MTTKISITTALKIIRSNKDFIFYRIEGNKIVDFTLTNDISRFRSQYNNNFKIVADIKKQINNNLKINLQEQNKRTTFTKNLKTIIMNRKEMIDYIIEYAGEEFEDEDDYIELAKMSKSELKANIENIKDYLLEEEL